MTRIANKNTAGLMGPGHVKTLEGATQSTKEFVATGSISANQFVALRSDGTVEVVTGTETLASIGAFVTTTQINNITVIQLLYNATANKIALTYYSSGDTNKPRIVIGTISGNVITFGTTVIIDNGNTSYVTTKFVWNAAGTKIIATYTLVTPNFTTFVVGDVSGNTITFGTPIYTYTDDYVRFLYHDDAHGSRIIIGNYSSIRAATYSGTTITLGSVAAHSINSADYWEYYYKSSENKIIVWTRQSNKCVVATISGTAVTIGTPATISVGGTAFYDSANNRLLCMAAYTGGYYTISSYTVSGTTVTNAGNVKTTYTSTTYYEASGGYHVFYSGYDPISSRYVVIQGSYGSDDLGKAVGLEAYIINTAGGVCEVTAPFIISTNKGQLLKVFFNSNGRIVIIYKDFTEYCRWYAISGYVINGEFVVSDKTLLNSILPMDANGSTSETISFNNTVVNVNSWKVISGDFFYSFAVTLPSETSNRESWLGQSTQTVSTGNPTKIKLRGNIATGLSGLTPNTTYYLNGDGTLITTNNGVKIGTALSSTELLMEKI